MKNRKPWLLFQIENQVREFDAKLLLACVAAQRGFSSVIGPRRELEFRIPSFPKSIFLSNHLRSGNGRLFRILHKLGHICVALDEEALVHLPAETYYSRRLSPVAMGYVSHYLAWGKDNAGLLQKCPYLPKDAKIHVTGNPRNDLLRVEMRSFYEDTVNKIRATYGDIILVNTNFHHVNAFSPVQNLFKPVKNSGEEPRIGRGARGMTREYAEGLRDHKQAIFESFQELIPALERAFPNCAIIVRPHPTESQDIYHMIAARCKQVRVTNEHNIVPWLLASKALIHNGCTTGVEAYAIGVPAISYRAAVNDFYDFGFFRVPNQLSHQCFSLEELRLTLQKILVGDLGVVNGDESKMLLHQYLAAQNGPFACERIANILEEVAESQAEWPKPSVGDWFEGRYRSAWRRLQKQFKSYLPGANISYDLQRHRYPGISLEEVLKCVSQIRKVLDYREPIKVNPIYKQLYRISH